MTLHFVGLRSAATVLEKGTSQLAHRHPSVELLRGITERDNVSLPTLHAGRVLGALPGGGEDEDMGNVG